MKEKFYSQKKFFYSVSFDDYYQELREKYSVNLNLQIDCCFELPVPVAFKAGDKIQISILDEGPLLVILHAFEIERVDYLLLPVSPEDKNEKVYADQYELNHELVLKTIDKEKLTKNIEETIKSKKEDKEKESRME